MHRLFFALLVALSVSGCDFADESFELSETSTIELESLPVTLEGRLYADVWVEDVDAKGKRFGSSFGTLTLDAGEVFIRVSDDVVRSAGLDEAEGQVRATLSSKLDLSGEIFYQITKLERL